MRCDELVSRPGESMTLNRLTLQKAEINAGSIEPLRFVKGLASKGKHCITEAVLGELSIQQNCKKNSKIPHNLAKK